ncbi:MAG: MMPL family transporter [Flavobacteriales bacterium]|nr:MMPL family transporter [Flavobacteriales bacterium]
MNKEPLPAEVWLTKRNAHFTLLLIGLVSLAALFSLRNVRVDYDFEKFFPKNDPELDRYLAFRDRFGYDNDFLMFGIERNDGVFDQELLVRVDSFAGRLERLPLVIKVLSPTRLNEPVFTPFGVFETPYLRLGNDTLIAIDSARIWNDPRIKDFFFTKDAKAMLVVLNAEPGLSKLRCDSLLAGVREVMARSGFADARMVGRIVGQDHYINTMVKEMLFFLTASIALLAIFLWFGFRSIHGIVIPILVVGLAILWQLGLMTALGKPLGILTMLLPTILFVVGMSDVVHLLECYLEEIRNGVPRIRAIAVTYHEVGLPTFLTAITSGIGFATLGTASIQPLQEFGLYTALGVLVAFCLAFALLPALLVLTDPAKLLPQTAKSSPWDKRLPRLFQWTIKRRRAILWSFALISVVGIAGAYRIKVNNFLLEDLPNNDPLKKGFVWFEEKFGGVRPFEMEIVVADSNSTIWDLETLRQIEQVQQHLDTVYDVDGIISPVTVMYSLNKAFNGGDRSYYRLPDDPEECARMSKRAKLLGKELLGPIVSSDGRTARLTGRLVDEGGYVHKGKNAALDSFIATHTNPGSVRMHQTGMAYLIDRNNETLSTQLVGGMGIAVLLTALIMLWFFRDWRMVVVALIPNLVPLVFIAGVMGFIGIDLKVSTAIIFTISFGIAEDDTIHMLASLRQHLRQGLSPAYALKRTYLRTGKAVTVTSLMLLSGFVTLVFSDFASVFYMGVLITFTLALAYVAELLLLPALVMVLMRSRTALELPRSRSERDPIQ